MRFENYASPNFPRQTVILPEFSPNSDVNFTLLAALIGHPAFGKPEVSLELYRGWYAIFQVPKNFTCVFTQFHAIFTLFGLFQHVGYQKACTRAEKFIGDTSRCCRHTKGDRESKKEAKGLQRVPKAPKNPSARARIVAKRGHVF